MIQGLLERSNLKRVGQGGGVGQKVPIDEGREIVDLLLFY